MRNFSRLALVATVALSGCFTDPDPDLDSEAQAVIGQNGVNLNGVNLNGVRLNGVRLNGVNLNGVNLNGEALTGSQLTAVQNGAPVPNSALIGSQWDGVLSDGTVFPLRLDSISRGTGANSDVAMYGVSYRTTAGWSRLCGTGIDGAPVLALAVAGTWNYDQGVAGGGAYSPSATGFTFGCRGTAIAKCVEMGYKPWNNLTAHLGTCTRALRADFCGDGISYTVDGTTINIYDAVGVQADTEAWTHEAEWSVNGAECISKKKETRFYQAAGVRPTCLETLKTRTCQGFGATVKIRTELPSL